ncbi:PREDICTED: stromal cell-derived factor 2 [Charadrius vociferus]|nr:PREDICTED: stromal cell-derived factor 2 [Charadrius vociferus]
MEIRSKYQQNIRICYRKSFCAFPVTVATLARQGHNRVQDSIGNSSAPQELHSLSSPQTSSFYLQEVSAFGEGGEGDYLDDWTVVCSGTYWSRDSEVRFQHASTDVFLSVTGEQYGRPIHGQKEVHGMAASSQNNYWKVMEGIFMQPSEVFKAERYHAEL